jgi:hypothetical protein
MPPTDAVWVELRDRGRVEGWLARFPGNAVRALARFLYAESLAVMARAQQLVPVATGALRASGSVARPEVSGTRVRVVMGFGGPSAPYARRVHEDLGLRHPAGGQAKFLEQPALERLAQILERLKAFLSMELSRAGG